MENYRFVSDLLQADVLSHDDSVNQGGAIEESSQPAPATAVDCVVCRDFSRDLAVSHDVDFCAVVDLERRLLNNIIIDVALKQHVTELEERNNKRQKGMKALQEVVNRLHASIETLRPKRTS